MASMSRSEILKPEDFEAIREAVMETPRGRWFLEHYADRIRSADTSAMLTGMQRLEAAVAANHDAVMATLAKALANAEAQTITLPPFLVAQAPAPQPQPQADLAPKHMKFFKQDEEIFEPAPQATIAAVPEAPKPATAPAPKAEAPKGARVIIRRAEPVPAEPAAQSASIPAATSPEADVAAAPAPIVAPEPAPPVMTEAAPAPLAEAAPKRRIVIIRHKPGEDIDVPLQDGIAKAS